MMFLDCERHSAINNTAFDGKTGDLILARWPGPERDDWASSIPNSSKPRGLSAPVEPITDAPARWPKRSLAKVLGSLFCLFSVCLIWPMAASAAPLVSVGTDSGIVRTGVFLTLLTFVPALFICTTSFIRMVVVFSMVRHAFGMPETPPNAVLVSLAMLLTIFVMGPTLKVINTESLQPMMSGKINVERGLEAGSAPLRDFMLRQVRDQDLASIYGITNEPLPKRPEQVDIMKLIPAFIINELRVSFTIGFAILLPFLMIDLIVASILLALGMMMVPPSTISLPLKILMFVMIDGWSLVVQGLVGSFR